MYGAIVFLGVVLAASGFTTSGLKLHGSWPSIPPSQIIGMICNQQPYLCDGNGNLRPLPTGQGKSADAEERVLSSNGCPPFGCRLLCRGGYKRDKNGCRICRCDWSSLIQTISTTSNNMTPAAGKRDLSALNMEYSQLKQYCADNKEKCLKIKDQVQGVCALQPGKCDELMAILSGQETKGHSAPRIGLGGSVLPLPQFPLPLPLPDQQTICNILPQLCNGNLSQVGKRQIGKGKCKNPAGKPHCMPVNTPESTCKRKGCCFRNVGFLSLCLSPADTSK